MFIELESNSQFTCQEFDHDLQSEETDINNIRSRYALKILVEEKDEDGLENLFEVSTIDGALEIKIENDIEIPGVVEEEVLDEKEFIEEELDEEDTYIEDSDIDESTLRFKDEEDFKSEVNESFNDEEFITEDMNLKARKRKKERKNDDDFVIFDFICHICNEDFTKMSLLTTHCHKIHECEPQVLCFCGKTISSLKSLKIHKRKHFPENYDYNCKECKLTYKMKVSYLNHMKLKHGPDAKKFVCSQCARCFRDSRTLMTHEKTHLPIEMKLLYPCEICDKKFVNKNSMKSHIMSVHEMVNLFTCETCGKSFSTKSNLKSHLYSHSNEKVINLSFQTFFCYLKCFFYFRMFNAMCVPRASKTWIAFENIKKLTWKNRINVQFAIKNIEIVII